ncbi:MAG TPA: TonB-dependent siderophore receptor [Caulobacteraceae bacterium]|nr:TonB-dependent siderophore receptor [Caulobacteraceae bacterium]
MRPSDTAQTLGSALHAAGAVGICIAGSAAGSPAAAQSAPTEQNGSPIPTAAPRDVEGVVVTGIRPLLGDKIPLTVQDTPQSVNVVPLQILEQQASTRLEDALKNVPGITLNAGEGAARGDTINIRGFSAFNDFFLDGIRDAAIYVRDPFNLQSIEVLKGPSATLFGRGSTGGAVNQVSKAPSLAPSALLAADVGTNDELRGTLDLDQPIGPSAAFRLNAMGEASEVAGRDDVRNRHWGVAPEVSFGLGEPTTVTLAYFHLSEDDVPDTGIPFVDGAPAPVNPHDFYGLASDRATSQVDIGTLRVTHEFASNLSLSDTLRYANYGFDYQFDAPNFGSVASGGQGAPTPGTPLSSILVGRDAPDSSGVQTNLTDQLDLTARFSTGLLDHTLVAGLELARQTNDLDKYNNPFNGDNNWVPETPLLNPNPNEIRPVEPVTATQDTNADSEAAYLTDTMSVGSHLDVIAGVRVDRFAAYYDQVTLATGAQLKLSHVDVVPSPRLALVYKPAPWQSLYASFGTSFDPSAEALTLTSKLANLGPVKATTYEVGSKTSLLGGGLLITGALFHTEVDNAQINDPENPALTVLQGNERVQGFELGASGHVGSRLELTAGYTYLDGLTSGDMGTSPVVKYSNALIPNLARNSGSAWAEYRVTRPWEVGLGFNYLDHRVANVVAPGSIAATVPSYLVWNAMTSYRLNEKLTLQLNAINLFNTLYYDSLYYTSASENHAIPGAGRTLKLTVRAEF